MSGPYRFNQESAKSPLDRTTSPFSAGQPVSFKTNVNRAKTKKWVTAKKNAYDGDDWGDYDEYDEYGVDQEPPPPAPAQSQRYYAGGPPQRTYTDRSFTEPVQPGPPGKGRRNSFEAGEEHRAFSASMPPPQQGPGQQQYGEPEPQGRRDFTASAMPPPLQTQISPMPSDINASPARTQFPPRKSSIGQSDSPVVTSPRSRTGSHSDKPLPFVRPADIYRRVEEERERERASLDSSRPSLDSLTGRPKDELHSSTSDGGRMLQPLETVAERKSEYLPNFDSAFTNDKPPPSSSGPSQTPGSHMPAVAPPSDQGFRSVVDQAFTRVDDQNSIPPTPVSKDSEESDMTRTNTGSTYGISPIMSRVPSAATAAMKRNQAGEGSTPVITEEPSDAATTVPQETSYFPHDPAHMAATKPMTDHTRNLSSSSLPRSGLATPTRGDSPARSPVIAPQKDLPQPEAARIAEDSPERMQNMDGGLSGPSSAYASREADIATAAKTGPQSAAFGLGAAEKQSQDAFLDSHVAQSPIEDALPRSRSESPSKGRVQALAGKFGDVSNSRRGSTQSNMSRNSVQSWERSQDNSRAPSPTKGSPSKPSSPTKEFRPHLPGQWESYATSAATPMDQGDRNRSLDFGNEKASTSLETADLTPTTAKRPVDEIAHDDNATDPLTALKNAGAAMAQSIKATVGIDDASPEAQSQEQHKKDTSHGNMYMPRPLQLERNASSISSMPPTPPAKDTPADEHPPHLPSKDVDTNTPVHQKRPDFFPQLSTQPSVDDEESDRLRKEIVASLTPVASTDPNRASLLPGSPGTNRASSILPAEYDSYWADGGEHATAGESHDANRSIPAATMTAAVPAVSHTSELPKPSLLNRFSWEDSNPKVATSDNAVSTTAVPEPIKSAPQDNVPPPSVERAVEDERHQWSGAQEDPYFGPAHTLTITKPDPITDPEPPARSPTSPVNHGALASPTREHTRSPGLHVVNSAEDPEAVDLPPRLSADYSAPAPGAQDVTKVLPQEVGHEVPNAGVTPAVSAPEPTSSGHIQANNQEPSPASPTSGKPLGGREIATINSTAERIATYNSTRQHWATHDHGLEDWLTSAMSANPELANQPVSVQRPSTGTVRHKHTASLSLLGKFGSASTYQLPGGEHNSASTQAAAGVESPTTGASPGSSAAFDRRVASRQLEAKGKDLLHTANVLSGKGLTSAKGLFAKGKSRFGREKGLHPRTDSMPSSREASEEPELMSSTPRDAFTTTTPEKNASYERSDTDSPREGRKKRRFSLSSFHRSSRSRSRPSSIALPSNVSFFSSTPKGTPPRELSRILGEEKSRPHSYHAPDSWNAPPAPRSVSANYPQSTPPREQQSRLGILPSPAKSAFSAHDKEDEQDIPPVPQIPEKMRLSNDLSHEVLQSVIRYSTPPVLTASNDRNLATSPVFRDDAIDQVGGKPGQQAAYMQQHSEPLHQHKASTPGPAETERNINIDSHAPPQNSAQWPLVDFPSGAYVSTNGNAGRGSLQPQSHVPTDVHRSLFDEDDQPPRLSYEPIIPSRRSNEAEPLPSYLVPTHLDVSDDEESGAAGGLHKSGTNLLLAEPRIDNPSVSPLLPPAQSIADESSVPNQTQMSHHDRDEIDSAPRASARGATLAPDSVGPNVAHNEHLQPVASTKHATTNANSSILSAAHQGNMSLSEGSNVVLDATKREAEKADTDKEDRDLAHSPAPVWYASSKLHVTKARIRDAGNAEDHVHVSDHDQEKGGYDEANPGLATTTGVGLSAPPGPVRSSSALQVVHAVEAAYAASDSSFASWDDSALTNSASGSSQPGDMRDESDLVTPVAQVPRIVAQPENQAEASSTINLAAPNGYFTGQEPHAMHRPQQQSNDLTVPERSKSMLSMISSLVPSEGGTPISPTTSNAGRSTPSTIRRMQRESSGKNPVTSDRIPEESMANYDDRTPTAKDDDFDLYADHNGIVKDVQDESGRPLRVDQPRNPDVRNGSQSTEVGLPAPAPVISEPPNEDIPRYSTERPMSFVSGPTDQDGRPQDQLNQGTQQSNGTSRPPTERLTSQDERPHYSTAPHLNAGPRSDRAPEDSDLSQGRPHQTHMVSSGQVPSHNGPHRAQPQSSINSAGSNPSSNVPATSFQPPLVNGHSAQFHQIAGQRGQDPRMFGPNPSHVEPQRTVAEGRAMMPDQGPRQPNQLNGPNADPRNNYEYQQHMIRRQTQHPHAQAAIGQSPYGGMHGTKEHTFKQQEKSSSLPKFASVFKGFGGKSQGINQNQQAAHPPNAALQPDQRLNPMDHTRMPSSHSAVSSLHREQPPANSGDQVSPPAPSTRPPSNGAESHFSHVSQGSTNVQPAGSRVDLRKPASPMPFQGIPPKLVPASVGTGQGKGPEKKKRFSTLGNIFARSNDANHSKTKLSKEEKKAQKAQRHSTAPPMQNPGSQWPQPQQQQFRPPQQSMPNGPSQYPPHQYGPQQIRPTGPQYASQQTMSPASLQSPQGVDPYGVPQRYQQAHPGIPPQTHAQGVPPGQASAYQSTRQLAEQHQAAQQALGGAGPGNRLNMDSARLPQQQNSHGPPPGGYYNPNPTPSMPEKGAYNATQAARVLAEQQHRQMSQGRDVHVAPHDPRLLQLQHPQPSAHEQEAYRLLQLERLRLEQQRLQLEAEQRTYTVAGAEQPQHRQRDPQNVAYNVPMDVRQQPHQQPMSTTRVERQQPLQYPPQHDGVRDASHDELLRAHQERQQLEQQLRSQQYADRVQSNQRSVSGPLPAQNIQAQEPPTQRHVSSSIAPQPEPQYDTPQIPAAYNHVSGAFISPPDLRPQSQPSTPHEPDMRTQQYERQYSDAQMPALSPQVSAQSQILPGQRTHSDASIVSVVSPLSTQAQDLPSAALPPTQRPQKPRMSSISEAHPGTPERPWHLNFPEGATEQEIVRARQRQIMQQQFSAQQQQHAERAAQSPSPRVSSHSQSPTPPQPIPTSNPLQQGGGFKELQPRSLPQPYTQTDLARTSGSLDQARGVASTHSAQLPPDQSEREPSPASYPLPMSPEPRDVTSPVNPLADALSAPPPAPRSPQGHLRSVGPIQRSTPSPVQQHAAAVREQYEPTPPQEDRFVAPPPGQNPQFEQNLPDDPPPLYDGPGMPNDGMDKGRPDRVRPPNIATDVGSNTRGRQGEPRARQPSIGILQHPQPASMAASPQRSSADMGAESLRRQLLQQEEYVRMERIQRAQIQRAESERERLEREAARARARELERSVSGGTRVGSIRSVAGSRNGGQPGWERRGSTSRPVFELPAVEDDEPSMRATSYPGQEWVPHVWTDD